MLTNLSFALTPQTIPIFLGSYLFITAALTLLLVQAVVDATGLRAARFGASAAVPQVNRLILVFLLSSLAGLPPTMHFFIKLGLFSAVLAQGHLGVVFGFAVIVFMSWGVYLRVGFVLMRSQASIPAVPLWADPATPGLVLSLAVVTSGCLIGSFFLEDL